MSVAQRKRGARPPAAGLLESYSTQRLAKAGQCLDVSINSIALLDKCGMVYAIATAERVTLQDEA